MAPSFDNANSLFDFVVKHGNGVKGLVDSGLSKVPEQYIQPPRERITKQDTMRPYENVAIDLSELDGPNHHRVVEAIAKAAEDIGFFQVVNHGVPVELLESLKDSAHRFFKQSPEKKSMYLKEVSPTPLVKYGTSFVPEKEKALEWKDYISMKYTNDADALQYWPNECKDVALEYIKTSTNMVNRILEILINNLGVNLDASNLNAITSSRMVNMNFYPMCPNPELTVGVGRHSDFGTLTILLQDGIGGLYVKVEGKNNSNDHVEEWIEILPIPGALVINIGDTLQILSNGKYKSAEHRVRTTYVQSRVSVPIFVSPLPTTKIGPLPELVKRDGVVMYKNVLLQDYMNNFFGKAHEGKKSLEFAAQSA